MSDISYESSEFKSIQQWLVLIAMLLFFIDITSRRFGWQMLFSIPSRFIKQKSNDVEIEQLMYHSIKRKKKTVSDHMCERSI
jgi:hypothetical protein